jgi:hypothetical protein
MNSRRLIGIILSLSIVTMAACSGLTQKPDGNTGIEGTPIAVKGKIDYMKALGGHFVMSQDPAGEFIVVNPNPKVLEDLYKSGKTVSIEGHLTIGADHLFIEKIDGKPYTGAQ